MMYSTTLIIWLLFGSALVSADEEVKRPKVFLDKSSRIVEYQLKRLDNARLLLVETATDDPKYLPVFQAILLRPGLSRKDRDDALFGLSAINDSDITEELLQHIQLLIDGADQEQRVARELIDILLTQPIADLKRQQSRLTTAANEQGLLQTAGLTGLLVSGQQQEALTIARGSGKATLAFLEGIGLLTSDLRKSLRPAVVEFLEAADNVSQQSAAMRALAAIDSQQSDTFRRLATKIVDPDLQGVAVDGLLAIPNQHRPNDLSEKVVAELVEFAEATPAADRTSEAFLNAMQLADELLIHVSSANAKRYRDRLREIVVRVVRVHTVEEEMRFDKTFFVAEAGRPIQVILENEDLMPHNLVITKPGQLRNVALDGAELGTTPGKDGKLYVPDTDDVLFTTSLVKSGQREVLTFTAPEVPGEYPYVCTFPRHWTRMYGVMLVVPDLDEWNRNPVEPADPLGNTRTFVKNWTLQDFPDQDFDHKLNGRLKSRGAKLFKEATCLGCHKMNGEGGAVGPELTNLMKRWKGTKREVLREILEPSYKIDPKYAQKIIIDDDGRTTTGIVVAEDRKSISLLENAEAAEPTIIQKDKIDELIASPVSLMPKALLDKFSEDEILDLLNYVTQSRVTQSR